MVSLRRRVFRFDNFPMGTEVRRNVPSMSNIAKLAFTGLSVNRQEQIRSDASKYNEVKDQRGSVSAHLRRTDNSWTGLWKVCAIFHVVDIDVNHEYGP